MGTSFGVRLGASLTALAFAVCGVACAVTAQASATQRVVCHDVGTGAANVFGQRVWYLTLHSPTYQSNASGTWKFVSWGSPYLAPVTTLGWSVSDQSAGWDTTGSSSRWSHGSAIFRYLSLPYVGALITRYPYLTACTTSQGGSC